MKTLAWRTPIRRIAVTLALLLPPVCASAQELTPGAYWPLPAGSISSPSSTASTGATSPSIRRCPLTMPARQSTPPRSAYTRTLSIAGRSANVGFQLPIVGGHIEGLYLGAPTARDRFGLGDPRLSIGINLYGAPAMTPKAFASYRMRTLVGVSLTVAPPLGQYDNTKVINLGANRWSVKPEVGLTHAAGRWVVELMAGVWLFTDNTDFYRRAHPRTGSDRVGTGPSHLPLRPQDLARRRRQFLQGRPDHHRRCEEPRPPEQFTGRVDVLVGDRPEPFDSRLSQPRRLDDHWRRLHVGRRRLQLRLDSPLAASEGDDDVKKTFTILHTNDIHSNLIGMGPSSDYTPFTLNDDPTRGGFARLATLNAKRKAERQQQGPVLILDGGDYSMGTAFGAATRETGGELQLLSRMDYDATTLIDLYSLVVLLAVILSWVPLDRRHPLVTITRGLTEPLLAPIRKVLPPMGGLDLSPMVLLIALQILKGLSSEGRP